MAWLRVDDGFHKHRKQRRAGLEAVGLWTVCGSWSADAGEDGFIPSSEVAAKAGPRAKALAAKLVNAELWEPATKNGESGYLMHDFRDYNPTAADLEEDRRQTRERVAKWREKRRTKPASNGDGNASPNALVTMPQPNPIPSSTPLTPLSDGGICSVDPPAHDNCRGCQTTRRARARHARKRGEWCGQCDETTRLVGMDSDAPARCSCSSPLRIAASS